MFEHIFGLIAPHLCFLCRSEGSLLCPACRQTLKSPPLYCYRCKKRCGQTRICAACRAKTPLDGVIVATSYQDVAKSIVQKLKFERAGAAGEPMARLMAARLDLWLAEKVAIASAKTPCIVMHTPTARSRIRQRGYDQSARLARRIARLQALPYRPRLGRRGGARQVGANKNQRREQVRYVFYIRGGADLENAHVILVDDVITTGATLEAAARTLKHAGAGRVTAVVFAAA